MESILFSRNTGGHRVKMFGFGCGLRWAGRAGRADRGLGPSKLEWRSDLIRLEPGAAGQLGPEGARLPVRRIPDFLAEERGDGQQKQYGGLTTGLAQKTVD
ncbi:unnamed protein product [Calypogeia fissa]